MQSILIVTDDSKPRHGGVAEYLHNVATILSMDYDVRVLTTVPQPKGSRNHAGPRYDEAPWTRSRTRMRGDSNPLLRRANTVRWMLGAERYFDRFIADERPDLVLIGKMSPSAARWCDLSSNGGIPYGIFAYGLELFRTSRWLTGERWSRYLRQAASLYSISSATSDVLRSLGAPPERIVTVTPGFDPQAFATTEPSSPTHSRPFVLSVCRLVYRKGIDLALRAFAEIADEFPALDYFIIGCGGEEANLRRLVAELQLAGRVRFLGQVDEATKHAHLSSCELLLMPNRRVTGDIEGFGIVFLEAAAHGRPTVGGDNGGVVDAIEDGSTGVLVPTDDGHEETTDALRRLMRDSELRARMGRAGRRRAAEFSWKNTTRAMVADIGRLLGTEGLPSLAGTRGTAKRDRSSIPGL